MPWMNLVGYIPEKQAFRSINDGMGTSTIMEEKIKLFCISIYFDAIQDI